MAAGKSNFSSNDVEENRPDCRSLKGSVIMVNLSEILLGVIQ